MQFENVKKLKETVDAFVADLKLIESAESSVKLSALEKKALRELQLAQVETEMAGRDLYKAVQIRRKALRNH